MIHYIRGLLIEKNASSFIIEVHGCLGYEIRASAKTLEHLTTMIGSTVLVYTYLITKEEQQTLYGFTEREERDVFQELLKINNIGPKVALAILSDLSIQHLLQVIQEQNISILQKIPGIGRKTAERLLLELKNRLHYLMQLCTPELQANIIHNYPSQTTASKDATDALLALGYKPHIAYQVIQNIDNRNTLSTEDLIKLCLQQLMKHSF